MPNELPLTKVEMAEKGADSEGKNSRNREMDTDISRLKGNHSRFFKRFVRKKTKSAGHWKTCELISLVLATVVTISINALPSILYFTIEVSTCCLGHTNYLNSLASAPACCL